MTRPGFWDKAVLTNRNCFKLNIRGPSVDMPPAF